MNVSYEKIKNYFNDVDSVASPKTDDPAFPQHVGESIVHAQRLPAAVNLQHLSIVKHSN